MRLKPVAELIITIGPDASATAMISGQRPKPIFSRRNGTSASIGVVTMIRTYGAMIFSAKGLRVKSAASTRPIVEPIASPERNSIVVIFSAWISVLVKSCANVLTTSIGFGKTYDGVFVQTRIPWTRKKIAAKRPTRVPTSAKERAPWIEVRALQLIGPCSSCAACFSKLGISSRSSCGT